MQKTKGYSDVRLDNECAYCGEFPDTKDHVPPKVLLDKPFPNDLPTVDCCLKCNNKFSADEEYFACILGCIISGTTEFGKLRREKTVKILTRNSKLRNQLETSLFNEIDKSLFAIQEIRIENVLLKLAFGHAKHDNSSRQFEEPTLVKFLALERMNDNQRKEFFSEGEMEVAPEIGSRLTQFMHLKNENSPYCHWEIVQEGVYQYSVNNLSNQVKVKMLIWDYLACEVIWVD